MAIGEANCKPSSVQAGERFTADLLAFYPSWRRALSSHPSSDAVTRVVMRPTREPVRASTENVPLFGLAPGGVCLAADVAAGRGALLPHRFALTAELWQSGGGVFSVALCRRVAPPCC